MNKFAIIFLILAGFLLLSDTGLEQSLKKSLWTFGNGVAGETQYVAEGVSGSFLKTVDSFRTSIASTTIHYKNTFKYDIDFNTEDKGFLSYVFYIALLFISLFFIYKFLFYVLVFLILYWLYITIRNRF